MISGDQKLRERLRDLPTGYLLDLLAEREAAEEFVIRDVLMERGLEPAEIDAAVRRRTDARFPRGHALWKAARTFTLACTLLITVFNLTVYTRLLQSHSPFKGMLLLLTAGGCAFGFFLGYKLTTHTYLGSRHRLHCGFPLPVGIVDLQSGEETVLSGLRLILYMAVNAVTGLMLVLFPLMLIGHLLERS